MVISQQLYIDEASIYSLTLSTSGHVGETSATGSDAASLV